MFLFSNKLDLNQETRFTIHLYKIGLHHPLDDITNPKYKLLGFLTTIFLERDEGTSF
jgi:hypothetical protein